MGCRQGPSRRAKVFGVFIAGLILAMSLPAVAQAANVASFASRIPASGANLSNTQPVISVIVYDKYGVRGTYPTNYSMVVDGKTVKPSRTYIAGYGYKKFKLSYKSAVPLKNGLHSVVAKVKDLRGYSSSYAWRFRVDTTKPVTTVIGSLPTYPGSFLIGLSPTDSGSGVARTYWKLDGGATMTGTWVWGNLGVGSHTVQYWSVDRAGNTEAARTLTLNIVTRHSTPADISCTDAGCHVRDLASIHIEKGCDMCHGSAVTPSMNCAASQCHGSVAHSTHVVIGSSSAGAETCTQATCHGANVLAPHASCASCHASSNPAILAVVQAGGATCESCHTAGYPTIHVAGNAPHVWNNVACATSTCHPSNLATVHTTWNDKPGCIVCHDEGVTPSAVCENCHDNLATVHDYSHAALSSELAANSAGCVSCHGDQILNVLPAGNPVTGVKEHVGCTCHAYGEVDEQVACEDCHVKPMDASAPYPYHVGDHASLEASIAGTTSSACVSCHGTNLLDVDAGSMHLDGEHKGCLCHAYGEATAENTECADCHKGAYAPHGFTDGFTHQGEGFKPASGHNTTTFGTIGAKTKFDGTQGVTLKWESHIESASLGATWLVEAGFQPATRPDGITSVTIGQEGTVTTDWDFPTANVFWESGDASAPADAMFLNKDSVVTCEDCHAGLAAAGPHGSSDNWGLDPDYPADYSMAELTKQVYNYPSGIKLRSTLTTATQSYTSGMTVICSKCHDLENYQSGTTTNNPLPMYSTGDDPFDYDGDTWDPIKLVTISRGATTTAYYVWTRNDGTQVDPASITITGTPEAANMKWSSTDAQAQAWSQGAAGTFTAATVGSSNTAHSSHHQDATDGSAQCVSCHLGVPHGWKRPRLLVNTGWDGTPNSIGAGVIAGDPAPYRDPDLLGSTRTNGGIRMSGGFNRMGMLTLSAVDNHGLWAGSSVTNQYQTGAAYWSEPSCQACNDHAGEDGIRIIDSE